MSCLLRKRLNVHAVVTLCRWASLPKMNSIADKFLSCILSQETWLMIDLFNYWVCDKIYVRIYSLTI